MRRAELDAVTLDALGTLVRLRDPVPALQEALAVVGEPRDPEVVRNAFAAEVAHYKPRCSSGRDPESLRALREESVAVFLSAAEVDLPAEDFIEPFLHALRFEAEQDASEALGDLAAAGLKLAVVSNWDASLPETLAAAGLADRLDAVVTSAEVGADKPAAEIFGEALRRIGVPPERALHVGDDAVDEEGAARAGLAFRPAPLSAVVRELLA